MAQANVPSLDDVIAADKQRQISTDEIIQSSAAFFKSATNAAGSEQTAINAEGQAAQDINTIKSNLALSTFAKKKDAAATFGTDPDAPTYVMATLASSILDGTKDLQARDAAIQQKMDTGFFDDPISWITNQFTLPGDVEAYNNKVQNLNESNDIMAKLQARTSDQAKIIDAIDANLSETLVAAQNKGLAAQAAEKVAQSEQKMASLGLTYSNIRLAQTDEQFKAVIAVNNAKVQQQQLSLSIDANQIARERLDIDREKKNIELAMVKDKEAGEKALQGKLDGATAVLGIQRITVNEFKLMEGKYRDMILSAAFDPSVQFHGSVGIDMADSIIKANTLNAPLTPGLNDVRKELTRTMNTYIANHPELKSDPQKLRIDVQSQLDTRVRNEAALIPETGGIYSAPPLAKVLEIPAVKNTMLGTLVMPLAATPAYPTKPSDFYTQATKAVMEGKMTSAQAASELSGIFKSIEVDNNTNRQYQRLAIPMQKSFKASVNVGTGWTGMQTINMSNPVEVEAALIRTVTRQKYEAAYYSTGGYVMGGS